MNKSLLTILRVLALIIVSPLMVCAAALFVVIWLPCALLQFGLDLFDQ